MGDLEPYSIIRGSTRACASNRLSTVLPVFAQLSREPNTQTTERAPCVAMDGNCATDAYDAD